MHRIYVSRRRDLIVVTGSFFLFFSSLRTGYIIHVLSHSPQVLGKVGMGVRCSVLCKSLVPVRLKALRPVRHPSARATRKVGRWTLAKAGTWSPNGRSSAVKQSGRVVFWNVLSTPADVPPASCCNKSHRDPMLEIGQSGCA